jgi:hypothetical protein
MGDGAIIQKRLKDEGRAFFLKNLLFLVKMDESVSLQDHFLKIKDLIEQMNGIGWEMEEQDMVVLSLKSLLASFEYFIETLNITYTDFHLNFDGS